jgi:large subunit ribosomal protein L28
MSRICELTGKAVMSGNNVSHSQRKTRRKFLPNLHRTSLMSDALGKSFSFRLSARAIKTVEIKGGLDKFLIGANKLNLSKQALDVKKKLVKSTGNA